MNWVCEELEEVQAHNDLDNMEKFSNTKTLPLRVKNRVESKSEQVSETETKLDLESVDIEMVILNSWEG